MFNAKLELVAWLRTECTKCGRTEAAHKKMRTANVCGLKNKKKNGFVGGQRSQLSMQQEFLMFF